jgi:integrase
MLELMARSYMRIGEVLKLTPCDIDDRKSYHSGTKKWQRGRSGIPSPKGGID